MQSAIAFIHHDVMQYILGRNQTLYQTKKLCERIAEKTEKEDEINHVYKPTQMMIMWLQVNINHIHNSF